MVLEKNPQLRGALSRLWKPALWCAGHSAAAGLLCLLFVRLLPDIGGLLTRDETALRTLESLSRARVSPGLWASAVFCAPALAGAFALGLRAEKTGAPPRRAAPAWFLIWLALTLVPAFALSLWFARLNTVPVRVIVFSVSKML